MGWFAHPIFSAEGNYPLIMKEAIGNINKQEGRAFSRLPEFSPYWVKMIKGSADFLGLNYYTSLFVEATDEPYGIYPSYDRDQMLKFNPDPNWQRAKTEWLYFVPSGIRDALKYENTNDLNTFN